MPADPQVGFNCYREFARADEAVDQATVFALDQTVSIGLGTCDGVLQILERNELEPEVREFKYHAPGASQILVEEDLDGGLSNPELRVALAAVEVAPIPLPVGLPLLGAALGGLAVLQVAGPRVRPERQG